MKATDLRTRTDIRLAADSDVDRLRQLRRDFFETQIGAGLLDVPVDLVGMLDISTPTIVRGRRQHCVIAEIDGVLEGYAVALVRMVPGMTHSSVGSIEEVYVSPVLQRTGTAGRLVAEAVDTLRRAGAARIQTRVLAENCAARAFWRNSGFVENVHILELGEDLQNS